ncbi:uncharacterized protein LOC135487954 [Lineus longissimus]|uniref:uncharacterized protein LOC135487954 n=1 Tax=Lineus longissimus TaxID=88925 RepID=UPI00315DB64F
MLDNEIIKELIPKIGTRMKFARKYRNLLLCNSHDSSLGNVTGGLKTLFIHLRMSHALTYAVEQSVVAMQLLPIMLPPRPTKGHRPSVTEAMSSFIQFKQVTTNIPSFLQDLPSGAVQPFVLALGDRTSPTQAFLIIEKNALEYPTLLKAVEACFRLCMFLT